MIDKRLLAAERPIFPGTDAWSRAAQLVLTLAATHGRLLDPAALINCDVRELHALAHHLERERRPFWPQPWRGTHLHSARRGDRYTTPR
ncbi:MAG TPA: hypothetical protein VHB98_15610 [Chloroflexota bacterium]|nr:hypothetical protein [Chloroflexota bacterium]